MPARIVEQSDLIAPSPAVAAEATSARRFGTRSTAFIGSLNLLAQGADRALAFGLILVIADVFGAGARADLYFLASIAPLTIGGIVGEPVGRAFLSLLVRIREPGEGAAIAAAGLWFTLATFGSLTLAYLAVVLPVVKVVTPEGSGDVMPWLAFAAIGPALGVCAFLSGVLLWLESYVWSALWIPLSTALSLILLGVAVWRTDVLAWIALALAGGYVLTALLLLVAVATRLGFGWPLLATRVSLKEVWNVRRKLVAPAVGGAIGGQTLVLLERLFASTLGPGSVASLSYARGISGAPTALALALGLGSYPGMVRAEAAGAVEYLRASFLLGLRLAIYVGVGFAALFGLFGDGIVAFLLQRGAFGAYGVGLAGSVLVMFALPTATGAVVAYTAFVLYGIDRFAAILWVSAATLVTYLVLAPLLRAWDGIVGLALAFGVAQTAGAALGLAIVARRIALTRHDLLRGALVPILPLAAGVAGALGAWRLLLALIAVPVPWEGTIRIGGAFVVLTVSATGFLFASRLPEAGRLRRLFREHVLSRLAARVRE